VARRPIPLGGEAVSKGRGHRGGVVLPRWTVWSDPEIKDAEIERLKEELSTIKKTELAENIALKQLIRELARELGAYHRNYNLVSPKIDSLLQRAKEAAQTTQTSLHP
jgi:hypothetical protein